MDDQDKKPVDTKNLSDEELENLSDEELDELAVSGGFPQNEISNFLASGGTLREYFDKLRGRAG